MTTHDSALSALTHAVSAADSPLAANLAEILTDAIQELIEAELSARIGTHPVNAAWLAPTSATDTETSSYRHQRGILS